MKTGINDRKSYGYKLQETALALTVQTLCYVSSDRLTKVKNFYFHKSKDILANIYDYLILTGKQGPKANVENSESKKLIHDIKKKRLVEEDDSDEEDEQNLHANEISTKTKQSDTKGAVNERFLVTCSWISKLLMNCTAMLASEFAVNSVAHMAL